MNWLKEKWLNKAWIALELYGESTPHTRSKTVKKIEGKLSNFNEEELKKLEILRRKIYKIIKQK